MMSYYEYLLIVLALIFCGYACYTDLKIKKIRNICSLGLLYAGVLSQLMAWYLNTTAPFYILALFFGSGITAFVLYWFGIFSPGDSKLFWGLCLILPPPLFRSLSGPMSFPPLILLLNSIIPYTFGVLGYLFVRFILGRNKLKILRNSLMTIIQKEIMVKHSFNLLVLLGIGSKITYISMFFEWEINRIIQIGVVLMAFVLVQKLIARFPQTPTYITIIGFACICISLQVSTSITVFIYSLAFFFCVYIGVFVIAKQLILGLSMTLEENIDISNLKVGMIPAEKIIQTTHQDGAVCYEKRQAAFSLGITGNIIISPSAGGLSKEEITYLKRLADQGKFANFGNKIQIQPAISFAPVISTGAVLTFLCHGPFYLKLIQIF